MPFTDHQPKQILLPNLRPLRRSQRAYTLAEVMIAGVILVSVFIIGTQSILIMNRRAMIARLRTNARVIVERNIDQALSAPFSATSTPPILALTSTSGSIYDDDANGDNKVNLVVQDTGGATWIYGTLTRTVTAVSNTVSADIRRVTFHLDYTYRGKPYSYEMTTLRTTD